MPAPLPPLPAALYKAANPSATAAQVKAAILDSVARTTSLAGDVTSTGGRLDCAKLVPGCMSRCQPNQYCDSTTCRTCLEYW